MDPPPGPSQGPPVSAAAAESAAEAETAAAASPPPQLSEAISITDARDGIVPSDEVQQLEVKRDESRLKLSSSQPNLSVYFPDHAIPAPADNDVKYKSKSVHGATHARDALSSSASTPPPSILNRGWDTLGMALGKPSKSKKSTQVEPGNVDSPKSSFSAFSAVPNGSSVKKSFGRRLRRTNSKDSSTSYPDESVRSGTFFSKREEEYDKKLHLSEAQEVLFQTLKDEAEQQFLGKSREEEVEQFPKLFIHPDRLFRRLWDLYIIVVMLYTAFVSMYVVCFLGVSSTDSVWFWLERWVDISYLIDLVLNFFTGYNDRKGILITDGKQIAVHYLCTWFTPDFISTIPWSAIDYAVKNDEVTTYLTLLRFLKLLRLLKLPQLLRKFQVLRWMTRLEVKLGFKYARAKMFLFVGVILMFAHWIACLFYFFGTVQNNPNEWVNVYPGYNNFEYYVVALYWTMFTITTIGYGDVHPDTTMTQIYALFAMAIGASIFAYVVSSFAGLISELTINEIYYRTLMDQLTEYAKQRNFPPELHFKIRRHFLHLRDAKGFVGEADLLSAMTPELRAQALLLGFKDFVSLTYFLSGLDDNALGEICVASGQLSYATGERIFEVGDEARYIFLLQQGKVHRVDRNGSDLGVVHSGNVFGEEGVYFGRRREYTAVCALPCDFYRVPISVIKKVLAKRPEKEAQVKQTEFISLWDRAIITAKSRARVLKISRVMRKFAETSLEERSAFDEMAKESLEDIKAIQTSILRRQEQHQKDEKEEEAKQKKTEAEEEEKEEGKGHGQQMNKPDSVPEGPASAGSPADPLPPLLFPGEAGQQQSPPNREPSNNVRRRSSAQRYGSGPMSISSEEARFATKEIRIMSRKLDELGDCLRLIMDQVTILHEHA